MSYHNDTDHHQLVGVVLRFSTVNFLSPTFHTVSLGQKSICTAHILRWRVMFHVLVGQYQHKLFGIIVNEKSTSSPHLFVNHLFLSAWIWGHLFNILGYNAILKCFVFFPTLAIGNLSVGSSVPLAHLHSFLLFFLWTPPHFLTPPPVSPYVFLIPVLESAISPRRLDFLFWKIVSTTKIWALHMLFGT